MRNIEKIDKPTDTEVARKFISIESSANSRNKEFNLSLNDVRRILSTKKCYISGIPIKRYGNTDNVFDDALTFERLDNDLGYVKGNVVACSFKWNQIKGKLTNEEITILYKAITKKVNK